MQTIVDVVVEKLNYYMGEQNLSQHKLAVQSGLPYSTVKAIMRKASKTIDFKTIIMLADGLGIHVSEFVSGSKFTTEYLDL